MTPFVEIVAVPERGTMMGNRGRLHDAGGRIRRPWQVMRWLICRLEFHGRHREVMAPDRCTELFFLDEATELAAGHRPCSECRRGHHLAFRDAWAVANGLESSKTITADLMDARLHAEQVGPGRTNAMFKSDIDDLPDGVFVILDGDSTVAHLVLGDELLACSPGGYTVRRPRPSGEQVAVLTPGSTLAPIRAGYAAELHPSAFEP